MKQIVFLITLMLSFISASADVSPSGKEYSKLYNDMYFALSGGTYRLVDAEWVEDMVIPDDIDGVKVTSVDASAFTNRIDIETVSFGANIAVIDNDAFADCSALKKIIFKHIEAQENGAVVSLTIGARAFMNTPLEGKIVLPEDVVVNEECFSHTQIEKVEFKGNFSYGRNKGFQFSDCSNLKEIIMPVGLPATGMFQRCTSLPSFRLPDGLTVFPACLAYCSNLQSVSNVTNVTKIESGAFQGTGLKEFDLSNVSVIGPYAFKNTPLETVVINPDLEIKYGLSYFFSSENLKNVYYPSLEKFFASLPNVESSNVGGIDIYIDNVLLTELTLPTSLTTIKGFGYIKSLKKIIIPNNTRQCNMGTRAFEGCQNLESVEIGAGDLTFDIYGGFGYQFAQCPSLDSFKISAKNKCTKLPGRFFYQSGPLSEIDIPGVTQLGPSCFSGTKIVSLNLPSITEAEYMYLAECPYLRELRMPNLKVVDVSYFPPSLEEAYFDTAIEIKWFELYAKQFSDSNEKSKLHHLYVPMVTKVARGYDFLLSDYRNLNLFPVLKELSMPSLEEVNFYLPTDLVTADFPKATIIHGQNYGDNPNLEYLNIPEVQEVSGDSFAKNNRIKTLKLDKLKTLSPGCFYNSQCLKELNLPCLEGGFDAFRESPMLESIHFGNAVNSIRLIGNTALTIVEADGNIDVASISNCFGTENQESKLVFKGNVSEIRLQNANISDVVFEGNVQSLKRWQNTQINNLTFKAKVGAFDDNCYSSSKIANIILGDLSSWLTADCTNNGWFNGENINFYTLEGDNKTLIEDLTIPEGLGVRPHAFRNSSIKSVVINPIGDNEGFISEGAFHNCRQLHSAEIKKGITYLGNDAFSQSGLTDLYIPESVTSMGTGVFQVCPNLKNVTLSPSLKDIPTGTFYNCYSLQRITIPEGVETLGYQLINGENQRFKFISLPSTLKRFSTDFRPSLYNLRTDTEIYSWAVVPPSTTLEDFSGVTVHVPESALGNYKLNQIWAKANLIGDLNADHSVAISETSIEISVPANDIDADAKIVRYKVTCIQLDSDGNEVGITEYLFDSDGTRMEACNLQRREAHGSMSLIIDQLEEDTNYKLKIAGYTNDSSLVYANNNIEVKTKKYTGVDEIIEDVTLGAEIYNINGLFVGNNIKDLPTGVYLVKTSKRTYKKYIKR